jgi:integrase/recombinase XerC
MSARAYAGSLHLRPSYWKLALSRLVTENYGTGKMHGTIEQIRPANLPSVDPQARSARNAVRLWLAGFRSPNTQRAYERELKAFAEFARRDSIEDAAGWLLELSEPQAHNAVDLWKAAKLAKGNAPATVNRSMAALNSFVKSARRGGFTTLRLEAQGEATKAYRDTRGPGLPVYLRMLDTARQQPDRRRAARDVAILQLAFGLALRRAEISSLNIGDIDLEAGRMMITGKGRGEPEPLTLSAEIKEALADWLRYRRCTDPTQPLFVGAGRASRDNGRFTGDGIYKVVKRFGAEAGAKVRPHGLRHLAVTESLSRTGGDFRKVRAFSRHSSINIVAVYDDNRHDNGGEVSGILTALTRGEL